MTTQASPAEIAPAPADPADIARRWRDLRQRQPKVRAREAARILGVAEGQLVASSCGDSATRLTPDWAALLPALTTLGRVMALTRNDDCVHERHGRYEQVSVEAAHALVLGPDIDLRLFVRQWGSAFAVRESAGELVRQSLQIFDRSGEAVHKVYVGDETDGRAYDRIVERFAADDQSPGLAVEPLPAPRVDRADADVSVEAFRSDWRALRDTHDFAALLHRHGVGRQQALRLIGREFVDRVSPECVPDLFSAAAARSLPIMVFVGNRGAIQIHTGPVRNLKWAGPWFNVLDPGFNLHLRADRVASAWVVRKPTDDGIVTSLELFNPEGEVIAYIFGARKPGVPESEAWRALLHDEALTQRAA
jgi:putative hemin transport protein